METIRQRGYGRIPSPDDDRDHPLSRYIKPLAAAVIPTRPTTTWPKISPYDQGQTPQCVGFSGALGREITELKDFGRKIRFDGPDLYGLAKQIDGYNGDGTYIRAALQQLTDIGAMVSRGSTAAGVKKGDRRKIERYARIRSHEEAKTALLADMPGFVWIGLDWPGSWDWTSADGLLSEPDSIVGGHATSILWYDDDPYGSTARGRFSVPKVDEPIYVLEQSWGKNYGANRAPGIFFMPQRYIDWNSVDVWRTFDQLGD